MCEAMSTLTTRYCKHMSYLRFVLGELANNPDLPQLEASRQVVAAGGICRFEHVLQFAGIKACGLPSWLRGCHEGCDLSLQLRHGRHMFPKPKCWAKYVILLAYTATVGDAIYFGTEALHMKRRW